MHAIKPGRDSELIAKRLKGMVTGRVLHDRVSLMLFSTDASIYRIVPAVVVQPVDLDDVIRTVMLAADMHIPVAPRGAGTGLAGESLTTGIVMDFSRFMTGMKGSGDRPEVIVQPGAILERINHTYAGQGYRFGPDPASASRATVGGMIGNNSTGARSLRYGYTADHIRALQVVLATGRVIEVGEGTGNQLSDKLRHMLTANRKTIETNWPKSARNRAGYNLSGAVKGAGVDLIKLIAGSEGTLAIVTSATLNLVAIPKVTVILQANFDDLALMARSLPAILRHDPCAVELTDGILLKLAKRAYPHLTDILPDTAASLMIVFDGESKDDVLDRLTNCANELERTYAGHVELHRLEDPTDQARQFELRGRALPLLYRQDPYNQPIPGIEDVAVPAEKMEHYISALQEIFARYKLTATYYAHAGPGELHVRPFLDLRRAAQRKILVELTRQTYQLAWQLGGTISGEHGVGILRAWALRKQYGGAYDLMVEVKHAFDPHNILNPGKIITEQTDLPLDSIRADLKPTGRVIETALDFGDKDVFQLAQLCNGCGQCRGLNDDQLMCPVFRADNDESLSPRGRACILREYLAGNLSERDLWSHPGRAGVDLCLLCGNCVRECTSGVEMTSLVIEARARRSTIHRPGLGEMFFAHIDKVMALAAKFGPLANAFANNPLARRIMQQMFNMHGERTMPRFGSTGFLGPIRRLVRQYKVENPRYRAVWFLDMVPRYQDPELARAFVKVCSKNGIELIVPAQKPSGITELAYGHLAGARRIAEYNLKKLHQALEHADVILSMEPTAVMMIKKQYEYLIRNERTGAVANAVNDATAFLVELAEAGRLNSEFRNVNRHVAYHWPCHTRLLELDRPGMELLKTVPGIRIDPLPAQCCGLGGTFGLQSDKYELSMRIAEGLAAAIEQIDPQATCSECSSCRMQLEHIAGIASRHPIQILADAYD